MLQLAALCAFDTLPATTKLAAPCIVTATSSSPGIPDAMLCRPRRLTPITQFSIAQLTRFRRNEHDPYAIKNCACHS